MDGSWTTVHMTIEPMAKKHAHRDIPCQTHLSDFNVDAETVETLYVPLLCPKCNDSPVHACTCLNAKWTKSDITFRPSEVLLERIPHLADSASNRLHHAEKLHKTGMFTEVKLVRSSFQQGKRVRRRPAEKEPPAEAPLLEQVLWHCMHGHGVVRVLEAELCQAIGCRSDGMQEALAECLKELAASVPEINMNKNLFPSPDQGGTQLPVMSATDAHEQEARHALLLDAWPSAHVAAHARVLQSPPDTGPFTHMVSL